MPLARSPATAPCALPLARSPAAAPGALPLARILAAALCALLCVASPAHAQRFRTINYGDAEGLPVSEVLDVAQHPDRSVWVTTRAGPFRFDGVRFTPQPLPGSFAPPATHLAIDAGGSLWFATTELRHGLLHGDGQSWSVLPPPDSASRDALLVDLLIDGDRGTVVVTDVAGVWRVTADGQWLAVGDDGLAGRRIWSAGVTPDGLLVGHQEGLSRLVHERWIDGVAEAAGLPPGPVVGVCFELPGRTWLAGQDWIGEIESARGRVLVSDLALDLDVQSLRFGRGPHMLPDEADGLWLGTPASLLHYDGLEHRARPFGTGNGLAGGGVTAMLHDSDGGAWFASTRGLSRIPSQRFTNWDHRDGLLADEVTALLEDRQGRLVVGHNDGLSLLEDGSVSTLMPAEPGLAHADDTRVLELAESPDGTLWMARAWGGLQSIPPGRSRVVRHDLPGGGPLHVSSVTVDQAGHVWAGSHLGVWRNSGEGWQLLREPGLPQEPTFMRRVRVGDDGTAWIGTNRGVWRGRDGRWTRLADPDDPAGGSVFALLERPDGTVLAGTAAGLRQVIGDHLGLPQWESLRVDGPVYSLIDDGVGGVWIGTREGALAWDGERLRAYGVRQGLAGQETNRAAALRDGKGRIWLGTVGGLSCYRREYDRHEARAPKLTLGGADVRGEFRDFADGIELEHHEAGDVTFGFQALSFVDDGHVTYQARLEGFDEVWLPEATCAGGRVRYTGLPPGEYRLHVRARAERGPWSAELVSPPVRVFSPWWQQPWFLAGAGLLALGLAVTASWELAQRRRTAQLERLVDERTRALASAEQRYREMFDKNGAPQLLLDPEGARVTAVNRAAAELWCVPEGSLEGLELRALLVDPEPGLPERLAALPAGAKHSVTAAIRDRSGERRELEIDVSAYVLLERRTLHATVLDVTERKRLEQQLHQSQRLESIGRLAGGVAHDFNNLLTAVLGQVEQARLDLPDADAVAGQLDLLESAARRGARLTAQLLGFAREQAVEPRVVDLSESLSELLPLLRHLVREDVELRLVSDGHDDNVSIDPVQFDQVIINLVVNACDAMPTGGHIAIDVSVQPEADDDAPEGWVAVLVSDDGEGMPPEVAARAFEPFFTTKPVGRGTGLGLATCHGIVARAGGRITLDSQPGRGTTVALHLPRVDEPATVVIEDDDAPPTTALPDATVLLVEDEPMVREVSAAALERLGYRVMQAGNGHAALALAREHEGGIDLLLTDVVMPGMGGRELAEALLAERPRMAVLYASGYTAETLPDPHLRPGAGQLLRKPYRLADLRAAVEAALERQPRATR